MRSYWKIILLVVIILIGLSIYWNYSGSFSFSVCNNQFSFHDREGQVRECYRELGHKSQDISLCNKVTKKFESMGWDMRDSCILGVAEAKQDPFICENSKSEPRDTCLLRVNDVKKDPKVCELMNSFKDDCYEYVGTQLNNTSLCSKIQHIGTKNTCYFWVAKNTGNQEICSYIVNDPEVGDSKDYCLNELRKN